MEILLLLYISYVNLDEFDTWQEIEINIDKC